MKKALFYLLSTCFLFSSFGFFALLPFSPGGAKVYAFDILVALFCLVGVIYLFLMKRVFLPIYSIFAVLFIIFATVSLLLRFGDLTISQLLVSASYLIRLAMYFVLSSVVYNLFNKDPKSTKMIVGVMLASSIFIAVSGFIQLFVIPDFRVLPREQGWDPHINRLASTFFDPNFAGGYLVLGLILAVCMYIFEGSKSKTYLPVAIMTLLVALILTFSRSSWLMFSVVVFILGIFKSRKLLVLTLILMFLTYYLVPRAQTRLSGVTDPSDSAALRLKSWENALTISKDSLGTGVGFNAYRYAQADYGYFDYRDDSGGNAGAGADSSLLLVLATTGIPGLMLFVFQYLSLFLNGAKGWLHKKSYLSPALLISVCALFVHSQFVNSIFYPQFLLWIAVLSALSFFEVDLNG